MRTGAKIFGVSMIMVAFANVTLANECDTLDDLEWLTGQWVFQGNGVTVEVSYKRVSETEIQRTLRTALTSDGSRLGNEAAISRIAFEKGELFFEELDDKSVAVRFPSQRCSREELIFSGTMYGSQRTYRFVRQSDTELLFSLSFGSRASRGSVYERVE